MTRELEERLDRMFREQCKPEALAKELRKFLNIMLTISFQSDDLDVYKDSIGRGYFFLTMLCEHLDPNLGTYGE